MIVCDNGNRLKVSENEEVVEAIRREIFPFHIKNEYTRLYELASKDEYFGVWMELKDLIEVILKLPILLGAMFGIVYAFVWKG